MPSLLLEHVLGDVQSCDCTWPARVECKVRDGLDQLLLREAIVTRANEMRTQLVRTIQATKALTVTKLRSRFESCGRSHTSPNSTLSVRSAIFGAKLPNRFWIGVCGASAAGNDWVCGVGGDVCALAVGMPSAIIIAPAVRKIAMSFFIISLLDRLA